MNARDSQEDHRGTSGPATVPYAGRHRKSVKIGPGQWMRRFIIIEISEVLNTQEELEENFHSRDREHKGECTGTVTESGEHGNRKKTNAEDKKIR